MSIRYDYDNDHMKKKKSKKKKKGKKSKKNQHFVNNVEQRYKPRDIGKCGNKDARKSIRSFVQQAYEELGNKQLYFDQEAHNEIYTMYCYEHHSNNGNPDNNSYKFNKNKLKNLKFWETELKFCNVYDEYKKFGRVNYNQDWLEFFTSDVIADLQTIMKFGSSNAKKAELILEEYKNDGFYFVGEGTNILVIAHEYYPGVVFKIALDHCGLADNTNDSILEYEIPRYSKVLARHPSSLVSVHERYFVMKKQLMDAYPWIREKILSLLDEISKDYLIIDVCPDLFFLNYGIAPDGEIVILDGSDLYPKDQLENKVLDNNGALHCQNTKSFDSKHNTVITCGGKLSYTDNYSAIVCKKCGAELNPLCLRPDKIEEGLDMYSFAQDGFGKRGRARMEREELDAILEKRKREKESERLNILDDVDDDIPEIETDDNDTDNEVEDSCVRVIVPNKAVHESSPDMFTRDDVKEMLQRQREELLKEFSNPVSNDDSEESDDVEDDGSLSESDYEYIEDKDEPEDNEDDDIEDSDDDEDDESVSVDIDTVSEDELLEDVIDEDEDKLKFSVTNEDFTKYCECGLYLDLNGDFDLAWELYGLPIFISTPETDGYEILASSDTFHDIIEKLIEDHMNDSEF